MFTITKTFFALFLLAILAFTFMTVDLAVYFGAFGEATRSTGHVIKNLIHEHAVSLGVLAGFLLLSLITHHTVDHRRIS